MITTPVKQWRRQKEVASLIGKEGKLLQWTIIRTPSKSFAKESPYPVVIVELEDLPAGRQAKKRMIGQLVDWEEKDLVPNRKVIAVLRRLPIENKEDIISYHIKFKPV
ncbi:MAG TPA: OB-fold domain-containing protein [Candidatus Saccharimonadales bacterium]|nr:OB-fold domain-containing protein [Candidatus Saccharimonadales bacterium]